MDRMRGPGLKVERADEHIRDLEAGIRSFHERNPYEVIREEGTESGSLQYRFKLREAPPVGLTLVIGDALHNLRSALDHLWCQLVETHGKITAASDMFVISDDRNKFESAFKGVKKRIPPEAREVISRIGPYKGGNDALWILNKLDVIDKHRLLLAVYASNEAVVLTMRMAVPWNDEPVVFPSIGLRPAERRIEDEAILFSASSETEFLEHHDEPNFRIDIALDEPPVVECEPVVPLLTQLSGAVAEVIERLAPCLTE